MSLQVSVVVPTCGRPALLARCLRALERQSLPREAYEVIVVEDRERKGPAAARNRGWRRAAAAIVAFTDDDTEPARDWLEQGLAAFQDPIDAVTGRIVMPIPEEPTDYERDARGLERAEFVTANCFLRRGLLSASSRIVISCGLPRLTGPVTSSRSPSGASARRPGRPRSRRSASACPRRRW
jgi:glycosyltransferase involved in cell wall biosynthesis